MSECPRGLHAIKPAKLVDLSMFLDDVIAVRAARKTKFRVAIARQESMDAATVGANNCCELGQWLQGEGRVRHDAAPRFTASRAKWQP